MAGPDAPCEARHDLSSGEIERLEDEIYRANAERTGYRDAQNLGFVIEGEDGLSGAVAGWTWGGACELRQLWVRADQRGRGLGRALIDAAVAEARWRGCRHVFLSTYDFQAPAFYARLGFEQIAEIRDKPVGHVEFVFRRSLLHPQG